ncbi:hypothetical protein CXIVA_21680 [Clostridium sp. SY8519]|nr:hypothetical protein CXIVA_21680 [Clostridium sp. SY8519]
MVLSENRKVHPNPITKEKIEKKDFSIKKKISTGEPLVAAVLLLCDCGTEPVLGNDRRKQL